MLAARLFGIVELFQGLNGLDPRHLVGCLVANVDQRVDIPRAFARSEHLKLAQIQRSDWSASQRLVERMFSKTGMCCGLFALEALPDHSLDGDTNAGCYAALGSLFAGLLGGSGDCVVIWHC